MNILLMMLRAPRPSRQNDMKAVAKPRWIKKGYDGLTFFGHIITHNDEEAEELSALLRGHNGHVNLIPVNPIKERDFKRSDKTRIYAFQNKLEKNGINVTIRREMGRDIDGACGQLRRRHNEEARGLDSDKGCI